jgi:Raf kinase inhibitor-like YbhB/YbcL family protein
MALILRSPAFTDGGEIPTQYTCEGADRSPPLVFEGVPGGARSLALLAEDPDAPDPRAPRMVFLHWLVHDLPPGTGGLPEGGPLPGGARAGRNDFGKAGWGGPCPPIGRHRYFFRLYALDVVLGELAPHTKAGLLQALKGHVLDEAQLLGTYQMKQP